MTRAAEASLLGAATVLAAMGAALVNYTRGDAIDAQVALTLLTFAIAFGAIHLAMRRWAPAASTHLFPLAAFLVAVGITEIYRLEPELASLQRWSLLVSAAIAVLVLWLLRTEGATVLRRYRYLFLAGAVLLLLLPLLPAGWPIYGSEVNGSRLWVRVDLPFLSRPLSFQPGEIAKLFLVGFLASYLSERHAALSEMRHRVGPIRFPDPGRLGPLLIAFGASFVVLIYQRDLGASLLLFAVFITMLYAATSQGSYLAMGGLLTGIGGIVAFHLFDHVQRRVDAWIRPFSDFSGAGYQVAQGLFALGSGSLTGAGLGVGRPDIIPEATSDFIFAAVGEELGLAGSIAVLAAYALLVAAGFGIALRTRDLFRKLLAGGLTLVLAIQTLLILAGVLRLFPITGITLPFMSYGGSSLMANMVLLALLARISHEERV